MGRYTITTTIYTKNRCHKGSSDTNKSDKKCKRSSSSSTTTTTSEASIDRKFLQAEKRFAEAEKKFEKAEKRFEEAEGRFKEAENELSALNALKRKAGGGNACPDRSACPDGDRSSLFITKNLEKRKMAFERIERRIKCMEQQLKAIELKFGRVKKRFDEPCRPRGAYM